MVRPGVSAIYSGLLCATFTDAAVLCEASQKGTCFARYGSCSPRKHGMREAGARVLLNCVSQLAAKYRIVIAPVLSFFSDFYFRIFLKVKTSPKDCPSVVQKTSVVFSCSNCQNYHLQVMNGVVSPPVDKCGVCGSSLRLLGPIWNAALHDREFIQRMLAELPHLSLKTEKKIRGLLTAITEELDAQLPPLGVYTHLMISEIKSNAMAMDKLMYSQSSTVVRDWTRWAIGRFRVPQRRSV